MNRHPVPAPTRPPLAKTPNPWHATWLASTTFFTFAPWVVFVGGQRTAWAVLSLAAGFECAVWCVRWWGVRSHGKHLPPVAIALAFFFVWVANPLRLLAGWAKAWWWCAGTLIWDGNLHRLDDWRANRDQLKAQRKRDRGQRAAARARTPGAVLTHAAIGEGAELPALPPPAPVAVSPDSAMRFVHGVAHTLPDGRQWFEEMPA